MTAVNVVRAVWGIDCDHDGCTARYVPEGGGPA